MDLEGAAGRVRRRGRLLALLGAAALALGAVAIAYLESDLGEEFGDLAALGQAAVARFGVPGSVLLLYVEESGIPLPVPGDVYVAYLGNLARGSALELAAIWLAIVVAVTLGATNLYLIARRWGHRLVAGRFAPILHLDHGRLERVERSFRRWGAIAIIFGRHVPGFRIPITVMAGIFEVPYAVFAPSVAVSTGAWAAIWLYLGSRYGASVVHIFHGHSWLYGVVAAAVLLAAAFIGVRAWRVTR